MLEAVVAVQAVLVEQEEMAAAALEEMALLEDRGLQERMEPPILVVVAAVRLDLGHQLHIRQVQVVAEL
jgi:hypothetical protein